MKNPGLKPSRLLDLLTMVVTLIKIAPETTSLDILLISIAHLTKRLREIIVEEIN